MLIAGANIEARDYRGRTPLLLASELDRSVAASVLLDCGASAKVERVLWSVQFGYIVYHLIASY